MNNRLKYFKIAKEINDANREVFIKKQAHCRGNLNSMSVISLHKDTPEMAFETGLKKSIDNIDSILNKIPREPERPTPEKLLQAKIIQEAIKHEKHYLPFGEKIKFITSEMAIEDNGSKIVNDILGYSETDGLFIIELKSERLQTELIKQVENFEKIVLKNIPLFEELLNNIYGHNWDKTAIKKAIVWPLNTNAKSTTSAKFINIEEFSYDKIEFSNSNTLVIK